MLDFSAYLATQHLTQNAVNEALPDAPVRADRVTKARSAAVVTARQWLTMTLRRLAAGIVSEPARTCSALAAFR